ncbi:MAG: Hint domain-containing protein [Rhodobacteraceae bacterium]|nr:Hint domain-containing protein [Paracoccaceae bacterium]
MTTGFLGTFAISLLQSETDGVRGAPLAQITVGAHWRWSGDAVRLDGPAGVHVLDGGGEAADLRRRAQRAARRILKRDRGMNLPGTNERARDLPVEDLPDIDQSFVVSDGCAHHKVSAIRSGPGETLLVFNRTIPPRDTDLFVLERTIRPRESDGVRGDGAGTGLICFSAGTLIDTPQGPRRIEDIRPGDRVETVDDGPQEVQWSGSRRMTGARLHALPHYRPLRIRAGLLGPGRPDPDLLVSPEHRMLVRGRAARELFNESEVLVRACDLIDGNMVTVETGLTEITYCHLLFARHQIIRANGLESESFHPAGADLGLIDAGQRADLMALRPEIAADPFGYGDYARRSLSMSEAALLFHEAA